MSTFITKRTFIYLSAVRLIFCVCEQTNGRLAARPLQEEEEVVWMVNHQNPHRQRPINASHGTRGAGPGPGTICYFKMSKTTTISPSVNISVISSSSSHSSSSSSSSFPHSVCLCSSSPSSSCTPGSEEEHWTPSDDRTELTFRAPLTDPRHAGSFCWRGDVSLAAGGANELQNQEAPLQVSFCPSTLI